MQRCLSYRRLDMKKAITILLLVISIWGFILPSAGAQESFRLYGLPTATSTLLRLTNSTGETITGLQLLPIMDGSVPDADAFPSLLGEDIFLDGDMIGLWCDLRPDDLPAGAVPLYDIALTFASGEVWTLHSVPVWDISEATICQDVHVAWLTYISLSTGEEVSTWLAELNILAEIEAADVPLVDADEREEAPERGDLAS